MTPDDCTPRCRQFLAELEILCAKYQVYITPSAYDMLQIWHVDTKNPVGFDWDGIEDRTPIGGETVRPEDRGT